MAAAWKKQQARLLEELALREKERAEAERIAKEAKLASLGLESGVPESALPAVTLTLPGNNNHGAPPPLPPRSSGGAAPTPAPTPAPAQVAPPPKPAKPLPTPASLPSPGPGPARPSKSAPRPPPKAASPSPASSSSSASASASVTATAPASPSTSGRLASPSTSSGRLSAVKTTPGIERKDSARSNSTSGGLLSSISGTFATMKAKTSAAFNDVTTTVRDLSPFGGGEETEEGAAAEDAPRTAMVISSPVRTTHVGHLGYDANTQRFEARNLPPEWQAVFSKLDKTLRDMGADGLTAKEANFLLGKLELAPKKPAAPSTPTSVASSTASAVSTASTPTLTRSMSVARPPDELPPRPPSVTPKVTSAASATPASNARSQFELEELRTETRTLRERVRTLEAETRTLRGADAELRQVRVGLTDTRTRLERAQQRIGELERREKMLELAPPPAAASTRQSVAPGQGLRDVYNKELHALQERLEGEREALRGQLTKEQSKRAATESELETLKAELRSVRAEASELGAVRSAREVLQRELERAQSERDSLEQELQSAREGANTTTITLGERNEAVVDDLRAQLKRAQDELARNLTRSRTLEAEATELRTQLGHTAPKGEFEALQRDLKLKMEQSARDLAAAHEQLQQEQKTLSALRTESRQRDLTIAELRELNEQLRQQQQQQQQQNAPSSNDDGRAALEALETSVAQLREKLRAESDDWSSRVDSLRSEKNAMESQLGDVKAQLAAARAASDSLEAERKDTEAQLATSAREISSLRSQLIQASSTHANVAPPPPVLGAGPPPPPPPPTGASGPPPPPPPPGGQLPKTAKLPTGASTELLTSRPPAENKPSVDFNASLLDSIRNPEKKLKKVSADDPGSSKIAVDKVDDSMLSVLAKALIDRRANMKEDHAAGQEEGWDD